MVQLNDLEILQRIVSGDVEVDRGLADLVDRGSGLFSPPEGELIDYKRSVDAENVGELARDILGFSNTNGGLLICGVADVDRSIVGHKAVDFQRVRENLGLLLGTRVDFELEQCRLSIRGTVQPVLTVVVRRSSAVYPNLLRKDIVLRPGLVRKLKYVKGTLFYRQDSNTIAESPYADIESRARDLGFTGAAPRTRTSFLLQEDKPGLRLYAPINDRFFGREGELAELLAKFDDPRGRGVSIAGFGGVGKTELAIQLVAQLHRRGKFGTIYSGSAKQTLLGPAGSQQTDPVFIDLHSFLADLAGWLGLNLPHDAPVDVLSKACLSELQKYKRVLLFVDNLETVTDRPLFSFLDEALPDNTWIVATSRVHKIRNFVYPKELREMEGDDAARLLRHELKRQGLRELASIHISDLREKVRSLYCHPLAIRWFAWACKKDSKVWQTGIGDIDQRELESFCVAHTLGSLDTDTQKVLAAVVSISGITDTNPECIRHTSGLPESIVERSLWDLECSGLVSAATDDDGVTTYSVSPLAEKPASDLARNNDWEAEYVRNLRSFLRLRADTPPESPLIRDLLNLEPKRIQFYTPEELRELDARLSRALPHCPDKHVRKLKWLMAETQRHLERPVSADDLYRECADSILSEGPVTADQTETVRLLLEAATVAKARAQTRPQIERAISYLLAIRETEIAAPRVIGMLAEMFALLGDEAHYAEYFQRGEEYLDSHPYGETTGLQEALERARAQVERRRAQPRRN
ncbi:MAG TPA: RNA-binding domain-containing protein [Candidatus Angelobacter sp.]|nr:RNA-binding domain-containing protein [Candidatus Angelobacter sp.]